MAADLVWDHDPARTEKSAIDLAAKIAPDLDTIWGDSEVAWVDVVHPVPLILSGTEGHAHVDNGNLYFTGPHVEGADGKESWTDLPKAWPHAFELFYDAVAAEKVVHLVRPFEAAARPT